MEEPRVGLDGAEPLPRESGRPLWEPTVTPSLAVPPKLPPHLLPGRSAYGWNLLQGLALLLLMASVLSWIWLSTHPELLYVFVAVVAVYVWTIWGYRRAAYRERDAGYTTLFGDSVEISLPGRGATPTFRLFSTADLYQLNHKTGEVVRRPGDPVP